MTWEGHYLNESFNCLIVHWCSVDIVLVTKFLEWEEKITFSVLL